MKIINNTQDFNIIQDLNSKDIWDYDKANIILNANNSFEKIEVKENSSLTILEVFNQDIKDTNLKREINLGTNAKLEYIKITNTIEDLQIDYSINSADNTQSIFHLFEIGEGNTKNTINSNLLNDNINIKINGLVKLKDKASSFNSFDIKHIHSNTFSDIKIRHLLDDNAKAEFEAITVIDENALYSKAFQDSKTILLSDDAFIKARPHLEILTDELEAGHGATTGGLDRDALYYLQSRGLDEKTAYKMLVEAFYKTSIDYIENYSIKEWIEQQIRI